MFAGRYRLERQAPYEPSTQLPVQEGRQVAEANLRTAGLDRPRDPPEIRAEGLPHNRSDGDRNFCRLASNPVRVPDQAVDNGNSLQLSGFRRIL